MIDYFKQILEETYEIFGTRQCENMTDEQYTNLLDKLVYVSTLYPYIPDEEQKKIINKRMVTDKEYRNINARLISTWLELDGKTFHKELAHEPTVEHEPASEESRAFWLNEWEKVLSQIQDTVTDWNRTQGSGSRLREHLNQAGIVSGKDMIPDARPPKPDFFCVMNNGGCKSQCERCKAESEIV